MELQKTQNNQRNSEGEKKLQISDNIQTILKSHSNQSVLVQTHTWINGTEQRAQK